ncbi:CHAD domain-containing protein [Streptomyces flavofungini]|uniref:CHAD domain-containing protein n=2 Tax=Streptomyces flavofungini TaxID=68200 RepID=A0ABS0X1F0_9ACTN|nr:CHAD domain-containing protein [Streptomyces flavofungini]MBJ3807009.1 CHAD domain-containing protein [Streptomyces flavofungini]GHC59090.1 CHAD domain-containing protein [Streptomyces flavofungini]
MTAGETLSVYLQDQATDFLRSLRLHRESSTDAHGAEESLAAARALRRASRRIGATLHTFRPLLDPDWTESLRPELSWLSGTLAREHAYAARLERLLGALHRLSTPPPTPAPLPTPSAPPLRGGGFPAPAAPAAAGAVGRRSAGRWGSPRPSEAESGGGWTQPPAEGADAPRSRQGALPAQAPGSGPAKKPTGPLAVGAAKAAALLERQLTLARTRAHSAALQAFGSSRFHAVADNVAVLASEVPLHPTPDADLKPLAATAEQHLAEAVAVLPLIRAGHPYNAEALVHGLAADTAPEAQDAPWLQVRSLLRLHRYAQEVLLGEAPLDPRILQAGQALDLHREAADAAAAAAAAARTPRIAPATAYALGVLHADQRHEVEAARFAFQRAWLREAVTAP